MREVWTVSVSSSPCSSPTRERAGTPAGPVGTDKVISCSHIFHASQYFSYFLIQMNFWSPRKVKVSLRVLDTPSSLMYFPIQVTTLILSQSTCGIKIKYFTSTSTFNYFTVKVKDPFVTILDTPRVTNFVVSCP